MRNYRMLQIGELDKCERKRLERLSSCNPLQHRARSNYRLPPAKYPWDNETIEFKI